MPFCIYSRFIYNTFFENYFWGFHRVTSDWCLIWKFVSERWGKKRVRRETKLQCQSVKCGIHEWAFHKIISILFIYLFSISVQNPKWCDYTVYYAKSNVSAGSWIFLGWVDSNNTETGDILCVGGMLHMSVLNSVLEKGKIGKRGNWKKDTNSSAITMCYIDKGLL